jgi:hypothetical protein
MSERPWECDDCGWTSDNDHRLAKIAPAMYADFHNEETGHTVTEMPDLSGLAAHAQAVMAEPWTPDEKQRIAALGHSCGDPACDFAKTFLPPEKTDTVSNDKHRNVGQA